jgi:hypothetical protein
MVLKPFTVARVAVGDAVRDFCAATPANPAY